MRTSNQLSAVVRVTRITARVRPDRLDSPRPLREHPAGNVVVMKRNATSDLTLPDQMRSRPLERATPGNDAANPGTRSAPAPRIADPAAAQSSPDSFRWTVANYWDVARGDVVSKTTAPCLLVLIGDGNPALAAQALCLSMRNYLPSLAEVVKDALAASPHLDSAAVEFSAGLWRLARVEDEHIQRVLAACGGNKSEAARRLGITRKTLQKKVAIRRT
jgi:DNA-binding protein Fis